MDYRKLLGLNFSIYTVIGFLALLVIIIGCDQPEKAETPAQITRRQERMAARALKDAAEKIVFISAMMNISYDTIYSVLSDYKLKTEYYTGSEDSLHINANLAIGDISSKYHISRKKISRILFAYKYEMITREEIEEETLENADQDVDPGDGPGY